MEEIIDLVTNPNTCELFERQSLAIERFTDNNDGIKISELSALQELIALCADKVENNNSQFSKPLRRLLKVCEKPFVQERANAKYRNADSICNILVTFSTLLSSSDNMVKIGAANVLFEFTKSRENDSAPESAKPDIHDQRPGEWTYNQHLFQKSGAMAHVAQAVRNEVEHLFGNDLDGDGRISASEYDRAYNILPGEGSEKGEVCTVSLMKLVRELAVYRENALSLNRENVPTLLIRVVSLLNDFRKEEIKLMVQILWSVLEHSVERIKCSKVASTRMQLLDKYRHSNALYSLGNMETLDMLRSLIERMLIEGYKNSDKELRNEVLIISSLLARRKDNLPFFKDTGFLSLLLLYSTASENELPTGCDERHFATSDPLDMEMKLLMWYLIKGLSDEYENFTLIGNSLFLSSLLFYIDPAARSTPVRMRWSPAQLRALRLNALNVLAFMVPLLPGQFLSLDGPAIIVSFLENDHQVQEDLECFQGDKEMIAAALQVVLNMCPLENYPERLSSRQLIGYLVRYLDVPSVDVRCTAALILAKLTQGGRKEAQKAFRKEGGITVITENFLVPDTADFLYTDSILIASLSCVHNAVVGCLKSELRFLADEGVEKLLDILELSSAIELQGQALAVLADIVNSNTHAIPYILNWKSERSGRSAVCLVLDIWLSVFDKNSIEDFERPLLRASPSAVLLENKTNGCTDSPGKRKKGKLAERLEKALEAAKSIMIPEEERRVLDGAQCIDIRDRIFALLFCVGFDKVNPVEALSRDQRIAFALCESYVDFVRGEEWANLRDAVLDMGLSPVFYDRHIIDHYVNKSVEKAKNVSELQQKEVEAKEQDIINQEQQFYNKIIEKREQAIQATLVKKQVSVMKRRLEQKEKQRVMLEKSSSIHA